MYASSADLENILAASHKQQMRGYDKTSHKNLQPVYDFEVSIRN